MKGDYIEETELHWDGDRKKKVSKEGEKRERERKREVWRKRE